MGLSDEVLKAIKELGFETPSPIQKQAIPRLMTEERDFIGLAQTGTGKTAAFGLPLLERLDPTQKHTQALVLAPTRELGQQIAQQLEFYSKYHHKINVLAVYGGTPITGHIRALKKPQHVIIATPGRLIDLIKRKAVKLRQLDLLVLDEADEMLNMGFKEAIDEILEYTPDDKKTWLFSATMPNEIKRIVQTYMENPIEVRVNSKDKVNTNIEHQYTVVTRANKAEALKRFLDINPKMRAVVFCKTKLDTQELAEALMKEKYKADAIHGDLNQSQRDRVMKRFKAHDLQILIATDVAARGIDVNDLTHVIHFALPHDRAYYTHRSGRTARAGKKGISLAFINGREGYKLKQLEQDLGIKFKLVDIPQSQEIAYARVESWCMTILEQRTKGKISPKLLEMAHLLFGNLSKEELITKILASELDKMNVGSGKDLNARSEKRFKDKKPKRGKANSGTFFKKRKKFKEKGPRSNKRKRY